MAITRQMENTLIDGLEVFAKAKANVVRWSESQDPRHAFYRLYRYESEADADAHVDYETFEPIVETRYRDTDDLPHGLEYFYRVADVDQDGDEGDLSDPASLEARGVQAADVEPAAIGAVKLNADIVAGATVVTSGPVALSDDDRNILAEITFTFDPVDVPIVRRLFQITGTVGSTSTLPTAITRLFINVDQGAGWAVEVGDYPYHQDFRPDQANLTGSVSVVFGVNMAGTDTELVLGLDCYIAAGESGSYKNCTLAAVLLSTSEVT